MLVKTALQAATHGPMCLRQHRFRQTMTSGFMNASSLALGPGSAAPRCAPYTGPLTQRMMRVSCQAEDARLEVQDVQARHTVGADVAALAADFLVAAAAERQWTLPCVRYALHGHRRNRAPARAGTASK